MFQTTTLFPLYCKRRQSRTLAAHGWGATIPSKEAPVEMRDPKQPLGAPQSTWNF